MLTVAGSAPPAQAAIHRIVLDGAIDPLHAEYVVRAIDLAEREGSSLVLIVLNTPGGLVDSMETMIQRMLASRVPVAVYVSPAGGKAASAGFFLLVSADVAAMAPGTRTGAAHPILSIGGILPMPEPEKEPAKESPPLPPAARDDKAGGPEGGKDAAKPAPATTERPAPAGQTSVLMEKITNDVTAYLRAIAERRGRSSEAATRAVTESKSWSDQEALAANLIDLVAASDWELLSKLDGREVKLLDGSVKTLSTKDQPITTIEMTFREHALSFLVNPNLAFLLLLIGALLIYVEVTHAGMILPGVIGGLCLLLAVTGFSFLPVTATGVLLLLAALGLFVAEIFVNSFGLLALLGIIALALGGIMLVDVPNQEFGVDPVLAISAALAFGAITVLLGMLVLRTLRRRTTTGGEGMIGKEGTAVTDVGASGKVMLNGEYWQAFADPSIPKGTPVRCVELDGLRVRVEPAGSAPSEPPVNG